MEKQYDPNKDFVLKSALYTYRGITFPHGSAILFSKAAAKEIVNDIENFFQICKNYGDDVAFGIWSNSSKIKHNLSDWESLQFAFNWPEVSPFPSFFRMFLTKCDTKKHKKYLKRQINQLAVIHFHHIDMFTAKIIGYNYLYRNEQYLWNNDHGRAIFCLKSNSLNILLISLLSSLMYRFIF